MQVVGDTVTLYPLLLTPRGVLHKAVKQVVVVITRNLNSYTDMHTQSGGTHHNPDLLISGSMHTAITP